MAPPARHTIPVSGDRQLLDAVLDAATSLIVVADPHGTLVRWNRACEQLLGYTAEELAAPRGLLDLVPQEERVIAEAALHTLASGESPVRTEFHWRTRDGTLRLIEWSNTALTGPDGSVTRVVGTGVDVTETREWAAERTAVEDLMVNAVCREVGTPAGPLDASVGYALFEDATTSSDEVLSRADDAMYADKAEGARPTRHLRSVE